MVSSISLVNTLGGLDPLWRYVLDESSDEELVGDDVEHPQRRPRPREKRVRFLLPKQQTRDGDDPSVSDASLDEYSWASMKKSNSKVSDHREPKIQANKPPKTLPRGNEERNDEECTSTQSRGFDTYTKAEVQAASAGDRPSLRGRTGSYTDLKRTENLVNQS
eukprot:CAMPEP_0116838916 /NCGR_PEP_ID=MMETSP0418-20121206/9479_1 /TAXON_ID=1158023 /ORGANISM="Astrosyne radiata, Strain 13vi08-1A" /LENGTH=162 /DNA_ID=CAMNT_0004468973 /DNA_START=115 /DNA_END=601 /DNA_ORIENTATION=+